MRRKVSSRSVRLHRGHTWQRFVLVVLLLAGGTAGAQEPDPLANPIIPGGLSVRLETVTTGLTAPNAGTAVPGHPGTLFVADQNGVLWSVDVGSGDKTNILDLSGSLVPLGIFGPGSFDERGLLGVAVHPDFSDNGLLYTYTSEPTNGEPDFSTMPPGVAPDHQSLIQEWRVQDPSDPTSAVDPTSGRELLRIDQPQFNHNAGALNFGQDGMLYVSVGDGGGADDLDGQMFIGPIMGHGDGNGQNPGNVLGTVLRIDPVGTNSPNGQYGIPPDNPFVPDAGNFSGVGGEGGCEDGLCDEIFAYGFRNPFRFSFDSATGDLYLGDVGQNDIEEVDVVVPGGNYGWRIKEGSFCFNANGNDPGFAFDQDPCPDIPPGTTLIDPVAEYDTMLEGFSVIGGFVYRGDQFPQLFGRYVFGDFTAVFDFANGIFNQGRLFYFLHNEIVKNGIPKTDVVELNVVERDGQPAGALNLSLLGFAEGANGEIYILGNDVGVPFGDTGVVLSLLPAPGAQNGNVCQPGPNTLCLQDDRFQVEVEWEDFQGNMGSGNAAPLTADTSGYFWFFNEDNPELAVKVLDATGFDGHFWVFYGGLTNVEFTLTVTDTATGSSKSYLNPPGQFSAQGDTTAFPTLD